MTRKFEIVKDEFRSFPGVDITLPKRGSKYSSGYDMYCPCDIYIKPHSYSGRIFLDIKAQMNEDEFLLLDVRSSIGDKKTLMLKNTIGVIDSDYYGNKGNDGNIGVSFYNYGDKNVFIQKGERIVQAIFMKYLLTDDDLTTEERVGGYGSTGKR